MISSGLGDDDGLGALGTLARSLRDGLTKAVGSVGMCAALPSPLFGGVQVALKEVESRERQRTAQAKWINASFIADEVKVGL
jgi:hypothetical protein